MLYAFFKPKILEGDKENLLNPVGFIKILFFFRLWYAQIMFCEKHC